MSDRLVDLGTSVPVAVANEVVKLSGEMGFKCPAHLVRRAVEDYVLRCRGKRSGSV